MGTNGNQKATGKRARTRELYSKAFKTKGVPNLTRHLKIYRIGDIVDIILYVWLPMCARIAFEFTLTLA